MAAPRQNRYQQSEIGLRLAIEDELTRAIKGELSQYYVSRAYDGTVKPIGSNNPSYVGPKIMNSNLINQVDVYFETDFETGDPELVVDFGSADYWYYVNYGRKGKYQSPGNRYPPIAVGVEIANKRGAYPGLTLSQTAYLINRSIGEYGTYGINFIDQAWAKAQEKVVDRFGLYGALWIENQINKITAIWGSETKDEGSFVISLQVE